MQYCLMNNAFQMQTSDGLGVVQFEGVTLLTGGNYHKVLNGYEGNGGIYKLDTATDILTFTKDSKILTILQYNQTAKDLGIELKETKDVAVTIGNAQEVEGGALEFTISINNTLQKDLTLNFGVVFDGNADGNDVEMAPYAPVTIKAGTQSTTFSLQSAMDFIDRNIRNNLHVNYLSKINLQKVG